MDTLSKYAAQERLDNYYYLVQAVQASARNNFEDMDFENADKRDVAEEVIRKIERDCQNALDAMDGLVFEG